MPVFKLSNSLEFPPSSLAEPNGLLCVGGDLLTERILLAYSNGIFPWYSNGEPILWWSPDPRLVIYPGKIHISRSLSKKIKNNYFTISIDRAFENVIMKCASSRTDKLEETWLTNEMIDAYIKLHKEGFAHSVECWKDQKLVGGLYGVSLGGCFFGESMFHLVNDASKIALVTLSAFLSDLNFDFIDCQVTSQHLLRMGGVEIPRKMFVDQLKLSMEKPTITGPWIY